MTREYWGETAPRWDDSTSEKRCQSPRIMHRAQQRVEWCGKREREGERGSDQQVGWYGGCGCGLVIVIIIGDLILLNELVGGRSKNTVKVPKNKGEAEGFSMC